MSPSKREANCKGLAPWRKEIAQLITRGYINKRDLEMIAGKRIDVSEALRQLELFFRGGEPCALMRPARVGDGIVKITPDEIKTLVSLHKQVAERGRMVAFVPASGTASRMFKDWYVCYRQGKFDSVERSRKFLHDLVKFTFYDDLKHVMTLDAQDLESYIRDERCADILEYVLTSKGLNYAWLPKALLKFHTYPEHNRTAMEEHLVEAAFYVRDGRNICRIHFTISEEHELRFRELLSRMVSYYQDLFRVSFEVDVTIQLPSTDTIAVDMKNKPLRDKSGKIMFRPGGHGALLQNLNAIDGDIIFIKNIDNVAPDRLKGVTVQYKRILGGYLVRLQDEVFRNLYLLSNKGVDDQVLSQVIRFCEDKLFVSFPDGFENYSGSAKKDYIFEKLNRPIRVCGMVKNEGEPGGGPFWVKEKDGTRSLQIVEQNQIDPLSEEQKDIWRSSTHFNPVDLVCGVRNYRGEKFDLNVFADKDGVSISQKPYENGELKILELPGLWNRSMAFWNTVFVEVPLGTFNPVKTVDDLLRESHQSP